MLSRSIVHTCRLASPSSAFVILRNASTVVSTPQSGPNHDNVKSHHENNGSNDQSVHNTLEAASEGHSAKNSLFKKDDYHLSSAFAHPSFTKEEMENVPVATFTPQTFSDRVAKNVLNLVRISFDIVTRYKHPPPGHEDDPKYFMTKEQWLRRIIFLESIAGVPGMVGGMVRHLHSLRVLRRDRAWIESLLEEAYNERMHLLSFIKIAKPGFLMRLMLLGGQGVFFNAFFVTYLMFPRVCHRFVGYLEEEAVVTYSRCIRDLERGHLAEFASTPAPDIAIKYWRMEPNSTVKDLMYYVRADESKHREVNHTLGNLKQDVDPNPYALDYSTLSKEVPHPTKDLKYSRTHPVGWEKKDIEI